MNCIRCKQKILKNPSFYELIFCKEPIQQAICELCYSRFEKIIGRNCRYCFKKTKKAICNDCIYWKKIYGKFVKHKSLYRYNDEMHDFFREYKRNGDVELSNVFSKEIGQMKYFENFDLITYIPSIHSHFKKRQFNPVKELYKQLPLENIFKIIDENDSSQAMKTRTERLKVSQKFQVIKDISEVKKIVIVDDVYTTGRTLNHAREAILNVNSNCEVETFSLAR